MITKPGAAELAKRKADADRTKPRSISFQWHERRDIENLIFAKVTSLEAEIRAAPTPRKREALTFEARKWRDYFEKFID